MRIGIDLHTVGDFAQGSRTYTYNVAKYLIQIDSENEYHLYFTNAQALRDPAFDGPNVVKHLVYPKQRIVRLPLVQPLKLAWHGVDLFHCNYIGPPFSLTPCIITLHDILHELYPQYFPRVLKFLMSSLYPASARKARKIVTVSEYSKETIARLYRVPESKIEVIANGVSPEFRPIEDMSVVEGAKRRYGIEGEYILSVGRLEPRKNIPGLVLAYHLLKSNSKVSHKLIIGGMKDFQYNEITATVRRLSLENDVILVGKIEQEDLPAIYSGASLFVYPSFAEGFGLPPLEAMACGTPVVTSNTTSLPEVVGDAAPMVDPSDTEALARAMYEVLTDVDGREIRREKGLNRARLFSWERTAEKTLSVYDEAFHKAK